MKQKFRRCWCRFAALVVILSGMIAPTSNATAQPLSWAPPPCGDANYGCVDLYIDPIGHQHLSMSPSNDYRLHLPSDRAQVGGITINGGHNVILIGGEIDLIPSCVVIAGSCHGIIIGKSTPGSVFIEGVWIRNPQDPFYFSTGNGIIIDDTLSAPNDITLQNIRIEGISGCSSLSIDNSKVYQPFAAPGVVQRIDRLTGTTNCIGLMLDPDVAYSRDNTSSLNIILKNTNINVLPNKYGNTNRYAYWFTYGAQSCYSGPISLSNVYAQEPDGTLALGSVWPDTNQPPACVSVWNFATNQSTFPNSPQISGYITAGLPPGGDFVPVGVAGMSYVSPGYQ